MSSRPERQTEHLEARELAEYARFRVRGRKSIHKRLRIRSVPLHIAAVPGHKGQVSDQNCGVGSRGPVVELKEAVACLYELFGTSLVAVAATAADPQQDVRPLGVAFRGELECLTSKHHRLPERIQRESPIGCGNKRAPGLVYKRLALCPGCARQLERSDVVVREHLGVLLGTAERLEPPRGGTMLVAPSHTGYLAVGDVADQDVTERVLVGACHRAPPRSLHEVLPLERMQHLLGFALVGAAQPNQRRAPEHLPKHGRVLQQALLLRREPVQAAPR